MAQGMLKMLHALGDVARSTGCGWARSLRSSAHDCEAVVRLDSDQVWTRRVPRGSDLRVTCVSGLVWMTREGDTRDHFLRVEDTYASREPGLVCVQAIGPAQLLVASKGSDRPAGVA